jgi:hypothetical protein
MSYATSTISGYLIDAAKMEYGQRMWVETAGVKPPLVAEMQAALDKQYGLYQYRVWSHGSARYVDKRLRP